MAEITNAQVLQSILTALNAVASRRTTQSFSITVIGAIIKTLQQNYEFLKYVYIGAPEYINTGELITISTEINAIEKKRIGSAIEAIIRIVYMDLVGKTGLFFMKELKQQAGEQIIGELKDYGVDLALLQTEQRYMHRQHKKKKQSITDGKPLGQGGAHQDDVSLLGYTWKNVGSWKYDPLQKTCVLYSKDGRELDRLNLDTIIESYITNLTEEDEDPSRVYKEDVVLTEKELGLLKMLYTRDMDAETATVLLHVSKIEFEQMVKRLLHNELLHYVSFNEIELTEEGITMLSEQDTEKKKNTAAA
ncbi:MAG: hypothetical protein JXA00_05625 [Candidatus Thermoplasmatota archaeon]|nr:hypothetical protein [Candidatus Thermoplasmatota archaeon]